MRWRRRTLLDKVTFVIITQISHDATAQCHMSCILGSHEPHYSRSAWVAAVTLPAGRIVEILGVKAPSSMAGLAAAIEKGLPRSALSRVAARSGLTGKARDELLHRVVPLATFKRRVRLKQHEGERTERLARVIALTELLWDDQPAAQEFLRTPHPELAGRTPLEAAATELGARAVEDVVMRALYGLPA
jgi:putative toxin-antitoxin system antitoxin component (TIGR02293 family)